MAVLLCYPHRLICLMERPARAALGCPCLRETAADQDSGLGVACVGGNHPVSTLLPTAAGSAHRSGEVLATARAPTVIRSRTFPLLRALSLLDILAPVLELQRVELLPGYLELTVETDQGEATDNPHRGPRMSMAIVPAGPHPPGRTGPRRAAVFSGPWHVTGS